MRWKSREITQGAFSKEAPRSPAKKKWENLNGIRRERAVLFHPRAKVMEESLRECK